ncbi:CinA family protein [Ureaplasma canigenitalium]|uniref:CinA family protein n=1 Tax=Ureaplasma canigenitalium TaxID=42092 RepID=UPI0004E1A40A|nr:CinA family protein [Ureaplasma canigenitalium]
MEIVEKLVAILKEKKLTISTVESATAGLFASSIGNIPGASQVLKGALVSYSKEIKSTLASVSPKTLEEEGAISSLCAKEMALGGLKLFNTDISVSITGNAGPSGDEEKPVGLFYIGIGIQDVAITREFMIADSGRLMNRISMVWEATDWLINLIKKNNF